MKPLKIEMIHDLVCSWCPIGYNHLKQALIELDMKADWHFLPFELNPDMPLEGEDINQHLARRYQWDEKKLVDYRRHLSAAANQAGVTMNFSNRTHYFNSHKAHRLMHWCERFDRQQEMKELLMDAYFSQGLNIGETQVLLNLVKKLGLDDLLAEEELESTLIEQQIQEKIERVRRLSLPSVPSFIFNKDTLITGSHSVEYFKQVIQGFEIRQAASSF